MPGKCPKTIFTILNVVQKKNWGDSRIQIAKQQQQPKWNIIILFDRKEKKNICKTLQQQQQQLQL